MTRPVRVAMFPRGIDGLFLPRVDGVELMALVARGTPEEAWARRVLPPERLLPYALRDGDLGPYPTTEALLLGSDIDRVLRRSGTRAVFMTASCAPGTRRWAERHGIRLLMVDYAEQRRLEDKLWFDAFLRRHGIAAPEGGPLVPAPPFAAFRRRRLVVQAADSMGGEGTWFVRGAGDVARLIEEGALARGQRYLVRRFVSGRPFGITVLVAPGTVALSAVRLQCYYPRHGAAASRSFAGVQWIPAGDLGEGLRRRIDDTFARLGELLYRRRFFGFANLDFMVDGRERIHVLECNPRMSAATPALLRRPELLSGVPAGAMLLEGFLRPRRYPRAFTLSPLPRTDYRGATLDIIHAPRDGSPARVRREHPSGRYTLSRQGGAYLGPDVGPDGGLHLFSFARAGQTCKAEDTLASVVSDAPLYDARGEMLAAARRILGYFRYTNDRP